MLSQYEGWLYIYTESMSPFFFNFNMNATSNPAAYKSKVTIPVFLSAIHCLFLLSPLCLVDQVRYRSLNCNKKATIVTNLTLISLTSNHGLFLNIILLLLGF
ncbi:hypothetical protein V8G54_027110 [Vigna mungo]|uniref:Uncharacterized protein n=1 Tax=Vigna mungo TaxID=3915 RepID=A0AAQ3N296_VIGMU